LKSSRKTKNELRKEVKNPREINGRKRFASKKQKLMVVQNNNPKKSCFCKQNLVCMVKKQHLEKGVFVQKFRTLLVQRTKKAKNLPFYEKEK